MRYKYLFRSCDPICTCEVGVGIPGVGGGALTYKRHMYTSTTRGSFGRYNCPFGVCFSQNWSNQGLFLSNIGTEQVNNFPKWPHIVYVFSPKMAPIRESCWFFTNLFQQWYICCQIFVFIPYYDLFSHYLHILDLQWRSPLCSLLFVDDYPCVHYFYVP